MNLLRGREERLLSALTDEETSVSLFISKPFDDLTFRLVMKLHRGAIHCRNLLSLFSQVDTTYVSGLAFQWASTCRIVNSRLLFRHQSGFYTDLGI